MIFSAFDVDDKPGCQRLGPGATTHGPRFLEGTNDKPIHDQDVLPVPLPVNSCGFRYRTRCFSGCLQTAVCELQMLSTHGVARMSTLLVYRVRIT